MTSYKLKITIDGYPAGSIVALDEWSWYVGADELNTRGSVAEGELALLFDYLKRSKSQTILEPLEQQT